MLYKGKLATEEELIKLDKEKNGRLVDLKTIELWEKRQGKL